MKELIDKLEQTHILSREEWTALISRHTTEDAHYLFEKARRISQKYYGTKVFIRGLVVFTN